MCQNQRIARRTLVNLADALGTAFIIRGNDKRIRRNGSPCDKDTDQRPGAMGTDKPFGIVNTDAFPGVMNTGLPILAQPCEASYSGGAFRGVKKDDTIQEVRTDGGYQMRGADEEFEEEYDLLNFITQPTRGSIIYAILGHPKESPTPSELEYMLPRSSGTIGKHLKDMEEKEILNKITVPAGERDRDSPNTFYTLSEKGWDLLKQHNIFVEDLDQIKEKYANVEKPGWIKSYEEFGRPLPDSEETNKSPD